MESRAHAITQDIPPGDTVRLPEIVCEDLARRPVACRVSIDWAILAE